MNEMRTPGPLLAGRRTKSLRNLNRKNAACLAYSLLA